MQSWRDNIFSFSGTRFLFEKGFSDGSDSLKTDASSIESDLANGSSRMGLCQLEEWSEGHVCDVAIGTEMKQLKRADFVLVRHDSRNKQIDCGIVKKVRRQVEFAENGLRSEKDAGLKEQQNRSLGQPISREIELGDPICHDGRLCDW